jgi:hypothetical protein
MKNSLILNDLLFFDFIYKINIIHSLIFLEINVIQKYPNHYLLFGDDSVPDTHESSYSFEFYYYFYFDSL